MDRLFLIFPPRRRDLLDEDELAEATQCLQVIMINIAGLMDNLAWAYVHRHEIDDLIKQPMRVTLVSRTLVKRLPPGVRRLLEDNRFGDWHAQHAKVFRDSLAHRIPPFIPPASLNPQDGLRFNELLSEFNGPGLQFDRRCEILDQLRDLGGPCFHYAASTAGIPDTRPLHAQILSDVASVIELVDAFRMHLNEAPGTAPQRQGPAVGDP